MADLQSDNKNEVTIHCQHVAPVVYNHFPRNAKWLSVSQVACGVVLLSVGAISRVTVAEELSLSLAVMAILAGGLGIAAERGKNICQISTCMICSIISAVKSCFVVLLTSIKLNQLTMMTAKIADNGEVTITRSTFAVPCVVLVCALFETFASVGLTIITCHFSYFGCESCCCDYDLTTTVQIRIEKTSHVGGFGSSVQEIPGLRSDTTTLTKEKHGKEEEHVSVQTGPSQ